MKAIFWLLLWSRLVLAEPWTTRDTIIEGAGATLHLLDWSQSLYISKERWNELNPILGHHPSVSSVNAYFGVTLVGHVLVAAILPRPWRELWQGVWIGAEGANVSRNFSAGVRLTLP